MEDHKQLGRVLDACHRALARLHETGIEPDASLVANLEKLEASLKKRIKGTGQTDPAP